MRVDANDVRWASALGFPVRERVEAAVECVGLARPNQTPIELLLFAPTEGAIRDALFYAILGYADGGPLAWVCPPEIADRTSDQSDIRKECGNQLWGGYARFYIVNKN